MKTNDVNIIDKLYPYFKMLDNINQSLTKIKINNINNYIYQNAELFYIITSEFLRLFPYKKNKDGNFVIDKKSGILLLSNEIDYIEKMYNKIISFEPYMKVFDDCIIIRNKYMHEPHNITCGFSVGATTNCSLGLCYKSNWLSISTISFSPIVYYLNKIFSILQEDLLLLIDENMNNIKSIYYKEIASFDFSNDKWHYVILPDYLMFGFLL